MFNKAHANPEPLIFDSKYNYNLTPESVCDELDAYTITQEERDYFANPTAENFRKWLEAFNRVIH